METFAYMDDISLGLMGITANTVRAFAFLRRELHDIGIVVNPAKTVALPPKGHAPTAEEMSLLESVYVRIADEGGVKVVGPDRHRQMRARASIEGSEGWRRRPPCALPR